MLAKILRSHTVTRNVSVALHLYEAKLQHACLLARPSALGVLVDRQDREPQALGPISKLEHGF